MTNLPIKTRFAPSPTGLMHFGNVRTALFNYLYAAQNQGLFLLRIEDTDRERSLPQYTQALLDDLKWLSLNWQEGPYFQSERMDVYRTYADQLLTRDQAYPCFCSEELLQMTRKIQLSRGQAPAYPGTCRQLTASQIQAKIQAGEQPVLRFAVPQDTTIPFRDLIKGPQSFRTKDIGDFVILRSDGSASFLFANVIDDALMDITAALRGEDHLTNTAKQLLLAQALGLKSPQYGHFPLILGPDHAVLSKRNGSRSIQELRQTGFLPQAILNYLSGLGHYYSESRLRNLEGLAADFQLKHINTAPAHYDHSQLVFWQKATVQQLDDEGLHEWLDLPPTSKELQKISSLIKTQLVFPQHFKIWETVFQAKALDYSPEAQSIFKQTGPSFFLKAAAILEQGFEFTTCIQTLKTTFQKSGKALFSPLRFAITGLEQGPELAPLIDLLGAEQSIARLKAAAHLAEHASDL